MTERGQAGTHTLTDKAASYKRAERPTWPALTNEPGLALTSMISPAMGAPTLPASLLSALSRAA